jgi:hypothetical protein
MMIWFALCSWPFVAFVFFRKWSVPTAVAATLIGGYLLLPEQGGLNLPLLPGLGKGSIPALSALLFVWLASSRPSGTDDILPGWLPKDKISVMLLGFAVLGTFGTALTNGDPINVGSAQLPGMRIYDGFSLAQTSLIGFIPFIIARKTMASPQAQRSLLIVLIVAASAYTLLALWEVRMSPQLNRTVYGFFPHTWLQHVRDGGFRPLVFLGHGLKLGIFLAIAAIAAAGMWRFSSGPIKHKFLAACALLMFTILMSKVLGAFGITLLMLPLVLFMPRHLQVMALMGIAILVLSFPILRNAQLVPTDRMVAIAESISPERAHSLAFRFKNEDILLEHAREKPVFGWGGFGRNRVFDDRGRDISTTDGRWVIMLGQGGWTRYLGEMGLLCWSILAICLRRDKIDGITIVLMFALAANLIDLLPNSGLFSLTWLLAGSLIGRLEYSGSTAQTAPDPLGPQPVGSRYTRQNTQITRTRKRVERANKQIGKRAGAPAFVGGVYRRQPARDQDRPLASRSQKKSPHDS